MKKMCAALPDLRDPRVSEFATKSLPTARDVSVAINAASIMQVGQVFNDDVTKVLFPGIVAVTAEKTMLVSSTLLS